MVTVSQHHQRPDQAQGNKPGWMMVPLPLGEPDPVRRLELIAAETAARKHKARPEAGSGIFRFVACQRVWYRLFPRQRSVNLVVSNVPGPPVPLYLAGARLLEVFPTLPPMGNLTLVVAALSYAGQLNLSAAADQDSCPDVEVFAEGVRHNPRRPGAVGACVCDHRWRRRAEIAEAVRRPGGRWRRPIMNSVRSNGCDLYYEEAGEGVPILLIPPAGATASTWGPVTEELARIGRVIAYDRRGYARTGGEPVRLISTHTADAAAIVESLQAAPAVVVGTSAGATIAVDLAVRRPELVQAVIAHEAAWRASRHLPNTSQHSPRSDG
jgi:hypothetical protein